MSRFSEPQDPTFQALNSSIAFDWRLAPYDIEQSLAHVRMLGRQGIIDPDDVVVLEGALEEVRGEVTAERFEFHPEDEDVHMAIERRLTEVAGAVGGKLHTARSRNDQVATDVAMFVRAHTLTTCDQVKDLMRAIVEGMAELPSGTVTFLLTDVEGSTALWEEAPEAMRAALSSGSFPGVEMLVLLAWGAVGTALTARTFRWE